jgi:hypothetical protein
VPRNRTPRPGRVDDRARRLAGFARRSSKRRTVAIDSENPHDPVEGEPVSEPEAGGLLGMAVARARRGVGMTRLEFAERLGEQLWTVEEWESGRQLVPPERVGEIEAITGASLGLFARVPNQVGGGDGETQRRRMQSLEPVDEAVPSSLTVDQISNPVLPRARRGFEADATRKWLSSVAAQYERLAAERNELRQRLDVLESAPATPDDYEQIVAERDELQQQLTKLETAPSASDDYEEAVAERDELRQRLTQIEEAAAEHEAVAIERDELRTRVAQLEASLEERNDYDEIVSARAKLEREIAEMWELLSAREDYDAIVAERDDLLRRLAEGEVSPEAEQALSRALLAASRAGEDLVKEAQAEAESILTAARASLADTQHELEERRRSFDSERETLLEAIRAEAMQVAREDLTALQQQAEPLLSALTALTQRIHTTIGLRLDAPEDEPLGGEQVDDGDLLDDLQARAESAAAPKGVDAN